MEKAKGKDVFSDDDLFNKLYPVKIREKAARHFTSLEVAKAAADFLAIGKDLHILDIGSGAGKFCIAAAHYKPDAIFYGVEQREELVEYAINCSNKLDIYNVSFIHGNFTALDFRQFDHFYFYNSFYENLVNAEKTGNDIPHSVSLFEQYNSILLGQLNQKPSGTRIATYHSTENEMPDSYYVVKTEFEGLLKFWIKV